MAETKKTNAPEETKEVLPAEKETEYGVDELIAARDQLFSCPDCAMVALKLSKKKSMTVSEAEKLVEEFTPTSDSTKTDNAMPKQILHILAK